MGPAGGRLLLLPPTSSLPSLRQPAAVPEAQVLAALDDLFAIYYPAAAGPLVPHSALYGAAAAAQPFKLTTDPATRPAPPLTDSGYNSGYNSDDDDADADADDDDNAAADADDRGPAPPLDRLRADELERAFATRWVARLVEAAGDDDGESALCLGWSEDARQDVLERAADLLNALLNPPPPPPTSSPDHGGDGGGEGAGDANDGDDDDDDLLFARDFTFALRPSDDDDAGCCDRSPIRVRVNDGLAGRKPGDHLDVGLQTWGASIVLCQMLCDDAAAFRLRPRPPSTVVELGAGTGLVSLVLAQLLGPATVVVATDYHPAVMANLRENAALNRAAGAGGAPVTACRLDWAEDEVDDPAWPLRAGEKADVLFATDVVYAAEHAAMLYRCASRLLASGGVFWLLATVRRNGRFNGVDETVEAVFGAGDRPRSPANGKTLGILARRDLEKRSGVGRGDETSYKLFEIGWASD